jgi:hypothetical protein
MAVFWPRRVKLVDYLANSGWILVFVEVRLFDTIEKHVGNAGDQYTRTDTVRHLTFSTCDFPHGNDTRCGGTVIKVAVISRLSGAPKGRSTHSSFNQR